MTKAQITSPAAGFPMLEMIKEPKEVDVGKIQVVLIQVVTSE